MRTLACLLLLLSCGCQTLIVRPSDFYRPDGSVRPEGEARARVRARQGLAALPATATPPPAPRFTRRTTPSPVDVTVDVALLSRYVWRGQLVSDDPVLQPAVTASWEGLRGGVWANLDLGDANDDAGDINEVDLFVGYERRMEGFLDWVVSAGAIAYFFPDGPPETYELHAGVALDTVLQPSLTVFYDVKEIDGAYVTLDVAHDLSLGGRSLSLSAGAGWGDRSYNDGYFGVRDAGLNDLHASASLPLTCGAVTVTPTVSLSYLLDGALRTATDTDALVTFGVVVSFSPFSSSSTSSSSPSSRSISRWCR